MAATESTNAVTADDAGRGVPKIRSIVNSVMEDGVRSAKRAIRHSRHTAEDAIDEVQHTIKRSPFQAVGVAFAAGVLLGSLTSWVGLRRR